MSTPRTPRSPRPTVLYFAFGSNLWKEQMARRCPNSPFVGIGRLRGYEWFINARRFANIAPIGALPSSRQGNPGNPDIQSADYDSEVWGLVYELSPSDEAQLDRNEGVPRAYQKQMVKVTFWPRAPSSGASGTRGEKRKVDMLSYIDLQRNQGGYKPREEYVHRLNLGIRDALAAGIPKRYVDVVMRRYIPPEHPDAARHALEGRPAASESAVRSERGAASRDPLRGQVSWVEVRPRPQGGLEIRPQPQRSAGQQDGAVGRALGQRRAPDQSGADAVSRSRPQRDAGGRNLLQSLAALDVRPRPRRNEGEQEGAGVRTPEQRRAPEDRKAPEHRRAPEERRNPEQRRTPEERRDPEQKRESPVSQSRSQKDSSGRDPGRSESGSEATSRPQENEAPKGPSEDRS